MAMSSCSRSVRKGSLVLFFIAGAAASPVLAEPPTCEHDLRADHRDLLPLPAPRTEYDPQGSVVVDFTVNPNGTVSDASFSEWHISPADDFMADYLTKSVQTWNFPLRASACRAQQKIFLKLAD